MLIKFIPEAPQPTVLFSLAFPELEERGVQKPHAWNIQLSALSNEDLEVPSDSHALDKAAGIPSLLDEVLFDVPARAVSCRYQDGAVLQWRMEGVECLRALSRVLEDVNESAAQQERDEQRTRAEQKKAAGQESLNSPPATVKTHRHKKQRSLLMSLVASIVPHHSHSRSTPSSPTTPSLPSTSEASTAQDDFMLALQASQTVKPGLSPRALRRRARSTLVDAFRRFVLPELSRRFPVHGYYVWVLQSMLRRTLARMSELVDLFGGRVPDMRPGMHFLPDTSVPSSIFYSSDEEDGDNDSTDDESSVHTPSSAHFGSIPARHHLTSTSSYHTCRSTTTLPPAEVAEYRGFFELTRRLRSLLLACHVRQEQMQNEQRHREAVLEVRSRRRAWLNRALVPGRIGAISQSGLAMPFQSSRLAQAVWTADDWEYAPDPPRDALAELIACGEDVSRLTAGLRRTRSSASDMLFPVSEVDGECEDEDGATREFELELGMGDLSLTAEPVPVPSLAEERVPWGAGGSDSDEEPVALQAPPLAPRRRTRSMHQQRLDVKTPVQLGIVQASAGVTEFGALKPLSQVERVLGEEDEFTLGMDVPVSVGR
ncbi:hypothetical protein K523DRAFT_245437 [Schizophyllum commune Tattone D]|nr:hypothetical protein K523DRAFT_245437 [Schizophyllum commune Tattone D]